MSRRPRTIKTTILVCCTLETKGNLSTHWRRFGSSTSVVPCAPIVLSSLFFLSLPDFVCGQNDGGVPGKGGFDFSHRFWKGAFDVFRNLPTPRIYRQIRVTIDFSRCFIVVEASLIHMFLPVCAADCGAAWGRTLLSRQPRQWTDLVWAIAVHQKGPLLQLLQVINGVYFALSWVSTAWTTTISPSLTLHKEWANPHPIHN